MPANRTNSAIFGRGNILLILAWTATKRGIIVQWKKRAHKKKQTNINVCFERQIDKIAKLACCEVRVREEISSEFNGNESKVRISRTNT